MIDWVIAMSILSMIFCAVAGYAQLAPYRDRHKLCLQRIEKLEQELFPDWFEEKVILQLGKQISIQSSDAYYREAVYGWPSAWQLVESIPPKEKYSELNVKELH